MKRSKKVHVIGNNQHVGGMFAKRGYDMVAQPHAAAILCFAGGADVHPLLYGERAMERTNVDIDRDIREVHLLRDTEYCRRQGDQVAVGICRGAQFLNVMAGGALWQHVDNHTQTHSALDRLTGRLYKVTSTHHQMMIPDEYDSQVLLVARESAQKEGQHKVWLFEHGSQEYEDVEAMWYDRHKFLCYQPHPEWGDKECEELFFDYINRFVYA